MRSQEIEQRLRVAEHLEPVPPFRSLIPSRTYRLNWLAASLLLINKIDLLPYVVFELDRCKTYARQVNPAIEIITLSATTGEGLESWLDWISTASRRERGAKFPQSLEALT